MLTKLEHSAGSVLRALHHSSLSAPSPHRPPLTAASWPASIATWSALYKPTPRPGPLSCHLSYARSLPPLPTAPPLHSRTLASFPSDLVGAVTEGRAPAALLTNFAKLEVRTAPMHFVVLRFDELLRVYI